ncbi:hypothetical protein CK623_09315 [Vandammella animalimorsus]|uniref:Uncharacterized protein n=1 Tax=Vandammella animalimorsus TaxID=2029117 RepID=A0A2A2APK9_9BURK|nr:hypothetical protein CK623_09315 [Vandammella animalimorsus]
MRPSLRLWNGMRLTRGNFLVPETPESAGNTTGDLAYFSGKPIRVAVGDAPAPHRRFGAMHMRDNAQRSPQRASVPACQR